MKVVKIIFSVLFSIFKFFNRRFKLMKKALIILITIVATASAIIGGFYLFKFLKKRYSEKKEDYLEPEDPFDTFTWPEDGPKPCGCKE